MILIYINNINGYYDISTITMLLTIIDHDQLTIVNHYSNDQLSIINHYSNYQTTTSQHIHNQKSSQVAAQDSMDCMDDTGQGR